MDSGTRLPWSGQGLKAKQRVACVCKARGQGRRRQPVAPRGAEPPHILLCMSVTGAALGGPSCTVMSTFVIALAPFPDENTEAQEERMPGGHQKMPDGHCRLLSSAPWELVVEWPPVQALVQRWFLSLGPGFLAPTYPPPPMCPTHWALCGPVAADAHTLVPPTTRWTTSMSAHCTRFGYR